MKRIMVFIKDAFVRNAQAKLQAVPANNRDNQDQGWTDGNGPMLIYDRSGVTRDEAIKQLRMFYPDADDNIFDFVEINDEPTCITCNRAIWTLIEIVKIFQRMPKDELINTSHITGINGVSWNQIFVEWANEFETEYAGLITFASQTLKTRNEMLKNFVYCKIRSAIDLNHDS